MSIKTGHITGELAIRLMTRYDMSRKDAAWMTDAAKSNRMVSAGNVTVSYFDGMPYPYVITSDIQPSFIGNLYAGQWRCIAQFPAAQDHIVIICQLEPGFMVWSLYGSDGFSAPINGSKCYHLRSAMQEAMRRLSKVTYPSDDYFDVKYENDLAGRS